MRQVARVASHPIQSTAFFVALAVLALAGPLLAAADEAERFEDVPLEQSEADSYAADDSWAEGSTNSYEADSTSYADYAGPDVAWTFGPLDVPVGDIATLELPEGLVIAGAEDAAAIMLAAGNPTDGTELAIVRPVSDEWPWFVVIQFEAIGYVKDDEKSDLEPDEILESIRKGTEVANEQRRKLGTAPISVLGWEVEPHYDEDTQHLEWAVRGESDGEDLINYNIRILGREGVTSLVLVGDPEELDTTLPWVRALAVRYEYVEGKQYGDFRSGDRIAKVGLAALVAGGAGAVLLKSGLLQKLWKFMVFGVIAAAGALKAGWSKLTGDSRRA